MRGGPREETQGGCSDSKEDTKKRPLSSYFLFLEQIITSLNKGIMGTKELAGSI
jgi:hypothetical protein